MSLRTTLLSLVSSFGPLAKPTITTVLKVWEPDKPELAELVGQMLDLGEKALNDSGEWKAEVEEQLGTTRNDLIVAGEILEILGTHTADLLTRVAALETQPDAAEELVALQLVEAPWAAAVAAVRTHADQLDSYQKRLDDLAAGQEELRPMFERGLSAADFIDELKAKHVTPTLIARALLYYHEGVKAVAENRPTEAVQIQKQLVAQHPMSSAVHVGLAVAQAADNDSLSANRSLKTAVRLKPGDAQLRELATAATIALTGRETPAVRPGRFVPPADRRDPQVGDTVDGWLLEEKIGGGGWGLVFRASKRGQTRAVKVMRRGLVESVDLVEAFNDEVFKLLRMRPHPNVVAIERNGTCLNFGCPYFVMPLLDGPNLEQHLDRHGVPTGDTVTGWLTGLLDALDHAHSHGLIHRDVKPQNVIILADGSPVLIDFGIAGLADVPGYTQAIGKSTFFAPPELQSLGQADVRADLYMLAATLFYALRYDQPVAKRAAFEFDAELVPEEFAVAFESALAQKPSKRPANVLEFRGLLTVNANEVEVRKKERAKAEAIERERMEQARQEAERVRKIKEAEEAERQRIAEEARQRERYAEVCRQNLTRWTATDAPQRWVSERLPSWDNAAWQQLLRDLEQDGRYWPMMPTEVGKQVEAIRERLNEEQRKVKEAIRRKREEVVRKRAEREAIRITEPWRFPGEKAGDQIEIPLPGGVPMKFAWCPPGSFMMGSNNGRSDEAPTHPVRLTKGFWAGVHPVTQGQWKAVMKNNPSRFTSDFQDRRWFQVQRSWWERWIGRPDWELEPIGHPVSSDSLPVEGVSWEMAIQFCDAVRGRLGIRFCLPTEAEWEYACHGGTTTEYYFGNNADQLNINCLFNVKIHEAIYGGRTTPVGLVGSRSPHPWHLTDLHGNVFEWCSDWYDAKYYSRSPGNDPDCQDGEQKYRVLRGGDCHSGIWSCRAAFRSCDLPLTKEMNNIYGKAYGLRVVVRPK